MSVDTETDATGRAPCSEGICDPLVARQGLHFRSDCLNHGSDPLRRPPLVIAM